MKWEYLVTDLGVPSPSRVQAALNSLGEDGWEIVSFNTVPVMLADGLLYHGLIFKRPVQYAEMRTSGEMLGG